MDDPMDDSMDVIMDVTMDAAMVEDKVKEAVVDTVDVQVSRKDIAGHMELVDMMDHFADIQL